MDLNCRKCGLPIRADEYRFGSEATGFEHMAGECPTPPHQVAEPLRSPSDPVRTTLVCNFCHRASEHDLVFGRSNTYCGWCGSNNLCQLDGTFAGPPPRT